MKYDYFEISMGDRKYKKELCNCDGDIDGTQDTCKTGCECDGA